MMSIPFARRIFVAYGYPGCLRIVNKSNWIGKALVFSRAQAHLATYIFCGWYA